MNKSSHFYFPLGLLLLGSLLSCLAMTSPNITTDQSALLSLKAKITSDPHEILASNWSATSSVCDWIGVTCGSLHRRVTALNISNLGLTGTIPPQLGNLSFLMSLNMSGNNFYGELPHDLIHLRRLRVLDFSINKLSGDLPPWIGSFQELQYFSLRNNSFTGFIPPSICNMSKLETLRLSFNYLQGTIPMEIGNLNKLKKVAIIYNQLSGSLPLGLFNISSLGIISFSGNSLSGSLPAGICSRLQGLTLLYLAYNKLSGMIPSSLAECSKLQVLSLSYNNLSGVIPEGFANLTALKELHLPHNNLIEYGVEGLVSTRTDVYSFGIILMETFSRMKPSDELFKDGISLKSWIEGSLPHATTQVVDANLLMQQDEHYNEKLECISIIFKLALSCCRKCPRDRINMKHAVAALNNIKCQLDTLSSTS